MTRYLKVHVETPTEQADLYVDLGTATDYTEDDLLKIGQDAVNEYASWGVDVIDESEVPERDR
jgi:hypothetical protein